MSTPWQELNNSLDTATAYRNCIRTLADKFARFVCGNLRHYDVSSYILDELKRELKDYNIRTGKWK